jgi:hypothetical protein
MLKFVWGPVMTLLTWFGSSCPQVIIRSKCVYSQAHHTSHGSGIGAGGSSGADAALVADLRRQLEEKSTELGKLCVWVSLKTFQLLSLSLAPLFL